MRYACDGPVESFYNIDCDGERIAVYADELGTVSGTFSVTGDALQLVVPELGYSEMTTALLIELDKLAGFEAPTRRCNSIAYDFRAVGQSDFVKCSTPSTTGSASGSAIACTW